ncbi:unnamed protein product [Ambrosiozyma monospora]|uniref:Unnamed protein product n=1 Tax=Ambrosiozyma monospora TaxID=43982 RepID=A0A9W6YVN2_AMBMO|nr:unnamed protein product [Ambrosiozyma monospora]
MINLSSLYELTLVNCIIEEPTFLYFPPNIKSLVLINSDVRHPKRGLDHPIQLPFSLEKLQINGLAPSFGDKYKDNFSNPDQYSDPETESITKLDPNYLEHSHAIPLITNLKQMKKLNHLKVKYNLNSKIESMLKLLPDDLHCLSLRYYDDTVFWKRLYTPPVDASPDVPFPEKYMNWFVLHIDDYTVTIGIKNKQPKYHNNAFRIISAGSRGEDASITTKLSSLSRDILSNLVIPKERAVTVYNFEDMMAELQPYFLMIQISGQKSQKKANDEMTQGGVSAFIFGLNPTTSNQNTQKAESGSSISNGGDVANNENDKEWCNVDLNLNHIVVESIKDLRIEFDRERDANDKILVQLSNNIHPVQNEKINFDRKGKKRKVKELSDDEDKEIIYPLTHNLKNFTVNNSSNHAVLYVDVEGLGQDESNVAVQPGLQFGFVDILDNIDCENDPVNFTESKVFVRVD